VTSLGTWGFGHQGACLFPLCAQSPCPGRFFLSRTRAAAAFPVFFFLRLWRVPYRQAKAANRPLRCLSQVLRWFFLVFFLSSPSVFLSPLLLGSLKFRVFGCEEAPAGPPPFSLVLRGAHASFSLYFFIDSSRKQILVAFFRQFRACIQETLFLSLRCSMKFIDPFLFLAVFEEKLPYVRPPRCVRRDVARAPRSKVVFLQSGLQVAFSPGASGRPGPSRRLQTS